MCDQNKSKRQQKKLEAQRRFYAKKKAERQAAGIFRLKEAKALGMKFYNSGKPCKHGTYGMRSAKSEGKCKCAACCEEHRVKCREIMRKKFGYKEQRPRKTKEERKAVYDMWVEKNREKLNAYRRAWVKDNKEKHRVYQSAYNVIRWKRTSIPLSKIHFDEILQVYEKRNEITKKTGVEHHVDHVIPLLGKNVCGLHVPWNLRVIPATENRRKSNRVPEEFYEEAV